MRNDLVQSEEIRPTRTASVSIDYTIKRALRMSVVLLLFIIGSNTLFAQDSQAVKLASEQNDQKTIDLAKQNAELVKQVEDLKNQLADAQRKFAVADEDRQFLIKEFRQTSKAVEELTKTLDGLADLPYSAIGTGLGNSLAKTQQARARVALLQSLNRVPVLDVSPDLKNQLETLQKDSSSSVRAAAEAVLKKLNGN